MTNETVPRRLSDVQAGSGSAPATACASTSPQCVTTLPTAPMVLTSLLYVVSLFSASVVLASVGTRSLSTRKALFVLLHFRVCSSRSSQIHMTNRIKLSTDFVQWNIFVVVLNVISLSLDSCVENHACV